MILETQMEKDKLSLHIQTSSHLIPNSGNKNTESIIKNKLQSLSNHTAVARFYNDWFTSSNFNVASLCSAS